MGPRYDHESKRDVGARRALFAVGYGLFLSALACGGSDYVRPLPGGYALTRTNASTVYISPGGAFTYDEIVPPLITAIEVRGDLIFGLAEPSPNASLQARSGYFLVDARVRSVRSGMTKAAWLAALSDAGVTGEPTLRSVRAFVDGGPALTPGDLLTLAVLLPACVIVVWLIRRRRRVRPRQ